jgi:uncharacterized repeat protein (TIGR03803 family)
MKTTPQHRNWISRVCLPAASAALALAAVLVLAVITIQPAQAQTFTRLSSFPGGTDGENPDAGLVQGTDGSLYGTTFYGGCSAVSCGTVFKITPTGTLTTIFSFCTPRASVETLMGKENMTGGTHVRQISLEPAARTLCGTSLPLSLLAIWPVGGDGYISAARTLAPDSIDCRRRSEPTDCSQLHSVRCNRCRGWHGIDSNLGHPEKAIAAPSRIGPPIRKTREGCARTPRSLEEESGREGIHRHREIA